MRNTFVSVELSHMDIWGEGTPSGHYYQPSHFYVSSDSSQVNNWHFAAGNQNKFDLLKLLKPALLLKAKKKKNSLKRKGESDRAVYKVCKFLKTGCQLNDL